ncbi:hypothetical protein E4U09_004278 [Claviceps aff. purpurea]|uniref:Uncharacterized protein n=1 Tax=Claviceps aff. purpurea TaxID=1967640 RepID=A0A9P7QDK5_9HYPO|nr:hypothetical protein E4U09_004278 [Claviceps aff. purpurea]
MLMNMLEEGRLLVYGGVEARSTKSTIDERTPQKKVAEQSRESGLNPPDAWHQFHRICPRLHRITIHKFTTPTALAMHGDCAARPRFDDDKPSTNPTSTPAHTSEGLVKALSGARLNSSTPRRCSGLSQCGHGRTRQLTKTSRKLELQQALRERYPEESPNAELRQGEAEDLSAYYQRVLRVYKRVGGRDEPVSPSEPLSRLEKYVLSSFIYKFGHGLRDRMLFLEALNRDVLGADSLTQALERVEQAATAMEFKANLVKSHNTNLLKQHQSSSKMFDISVKALWDSKVLRVRNAAGRQVKVTEFAVLEVNCQGVVRSIWAVVTPDEQPRTRTVLKLGLPWLYDVGAKFDIAGSKLNDWDAGGGGHGHDHSGSNGRTIPSTEDGAMPRGPLNSGQVRWLAGRGYLWST